MKKVISTRLDTEHLAKAIDGLLAKGYKSDQIATISNIVRLTFYYGLASLGTAELKASSESQAWVDRSLKNSNKSLNMNLRDLIK